MKNEYRGRTARFERNGHTFYAAFDPQKIRKPIYGDKRNSRSGYKALIRSAADGDVFNLVELSNYRRSKKNTKNHTKADYYDYYIKTIQIDNKVYDLIADVEKFYYRGGSGYIYTLALTDNNTIKAAPATQSSQSELVKIAGTTLSTDNIAQDYRKSNTNFQNLSKASYQSRTDSEYLSAVERGDMRTVRKMVKSAAIERFNPENKDIRYKKRIDSQYDFSLDKDLNTLDDKAIKVYNKRGWAYSLFSDEDMALLREKFDEYAQLNTRNKDNVLPDGSMVTDINNKMLLIGGTRNSPVIHAVLLINASAEEYAEMIKDDIYDDTKEFGIHARQCTNYLSNCENWYGNGTVKFYGSEDYYYIKGREQERAKTPDGFEDFGYVRDYEIGRRLREQAEQTGKIKPQKRVKLDQDQDGQTQDAQVQGGYSFNDFEVEFGEEIEDTLAREFETHHEDIGEVLRNTADIEITAAKVNSIVNRIIKNNLGEIDSKPLTVIRE